MDPVRTPGVRTWCAAHSRRDRALCNCSCHSTCLHRQQATFGALSTAKISAKTPVWIGNDQIPGPGDREAYPDSNVGPDSRDRAHGERSLFAAGHLPCAALWARNLTQGADPPCRVLSRFPEITVCHEDSTVGVHRESAGLLECRFCPDTIDWRGRGHPQLSVSGTSDRCHDTSKGFGRPTVR